MAILKASYGVYAVVKSEVYAKNRPFARWYFQDEEASVFWSTSISYIFTGGIAFLAISNRLS
jgi:hypothetical protein